MRNFLENLTAKHFYFEELKDLDDAFLSLENSYLKEEVMQKLKSYYNVFLVNRKKLQGLEIDFKKNEKPIKAYLTSYYELLTRIFVNYKDMSEKHREKIVNSLLFLDVEVENGNNIFTIYSPVVLNKLLKIKMLYDNFDNEVAKNSFLKNSFEKLLENEIRELLSFETIVDNRLQYISFALDDMEENNLIHKTKNSYKQVDWRLLESKIVYEWERKTKGDKSKDGDFLIAIIGDLDVEDTFHLLRSILTKITLDRNIVFHLYSDIVDDIFCPNIVSMKQKCNDVLENKKQLEEIISTYDVVFVLDCMYLYDNKVGGDSNNSFNEQKFIFSKCLNAYREDEAFLLNDSMLDELSRLFMFEQYYHSLVEITTNSRKSLFDFCENMQTSKKNDLDFSIYLYISNKKVYQKLIGRNIAYCETMYLDGNEFGEIQYSNASTKPLDCFGNEKIYFSFFSLLEKLDCFNEVRSNYELDYETILNANICLDYSNYPNSIDFICDNEIISLVLKNAVFPLLHLEKGSIFMDKKKENLFTFLVEYTQSLEDILFLYLLKENKHCPKLSTIQNSGIKRNINTFQPFNKHFYTLGIEYFDITSNQYIMQILLLQMVQSRFEKDKQCSEKDFLRNICECCEKLDYTKSYLYKNCKGKLNSR